MKRIIPVILLLCTLTISINLQAQKPPRKFGDIDKKCFADQICPIDSNAHAYFIFNFGYATIRYNTYFEMVIHRHFRIKIVDSEGYSWGDVDLPTIGMLSKIKCATYNLENGEIVEAKVKRKEMIRNDEGEIETVAMPNVREGSIIEIEYEVTKSPSTLPWWYFQQTIPVLYTEYHVRYPEYFHFQQTMKGYYNIKTESSRRTQSIGSTMYTEEGYSYYGENIPAFPVEDHLRTSDNYISKIEYELQSVISPFTMSKYYTTTWEKINENLLKEEYFGKQLNNEFHLRHIIDSLTTSGISGMALVNAAYSHIKEKIVWNEYIGKYADESLGKSYRNGEGSTPDINLNLVVLLKALGFECYPVVLSTQKNGIIHPVHPSHNALNYVIALVKLDGKNYLLDACDPYAEINLLPVRCLNDKGLIVKEGKIEWIDLMGYRPYQLTEIYNIAIDEDLSFSGQNSIRLSDYAAYFKRKAIKNYNSLDEYTTAIEENYKAFELDNFEVVGVDSSNVEVKITTDFTHGDQVDATGNLRMFSPAYQAFIEKNPFKLEERKYPVEFNYPYIVQQMYTYIVPENYSIEELPKPVIAQSPDKNAKYIYNVTQLGDKINVTIMLVQKKMVYLPEDYEMLKGFYQMIIDKQEELIVLKKNS